MSALTVEISHDVARYLLAGAQCHGADGFGCGGIATHFSDRLRAFVCQTCIGELDEGATAPERPDAGLLQELARRVG